jgi:hypothetical protein
MWMNLIRMIFYKNLDKLGHRKESWVGTMGKHRPGRRNEELTLNVAQRN